MKKKVIVGLSGGVDSSVAIIKLLELGFDVEAVFMRNWDAMANHDLLGNPTRFDSLCPQEVDYNDALKVAKALNVLLHRIDFVDEYWEYVFKYFLAEYEKGRTPNPDILCNKEIKFNYFLKHALSLGADYIAMGHYARVIHGEKNYLLRGIDQDKDQSYFLSQLSSEQLSKTLFPLGNMLKNEVRQIARLYQLEVASKKDSTGVCFIGERNFKAFLQNYLPAQKGEMRTIDEKFIGYHEGCIYYTIGQRKGLNIGGPGGPWFVIGKDVKRNILYVGQGDDQNYLYANRAIIKDINIINAPFNNGDQMTSKFRYRGKDIPVTVYWLDEMTLEVKTHELVKAMTPGQACVFYDGDYCLGGGTIDEVYYNNQRRKY